MSFCDHCEGQRFDRAQVLRVLRDTRQRLRKSATVCSADQTIALAIEAVRTLEIPHLESADEMLDSEVVH
jgi:imidazolonepropionase-like amidohydrolase